MVSSPLRLNQLVGHIIRGKGILDTIMEGQPKGKKPDGKSTTKIFQTNNERCKRDNIQRNEKNDSR